MAASRSVGRGIEVRFLVRFAVGIVVGTVLLDVGLVVDSVVRPWTEANTAFAAALCGLFGVETIVNGTVVSVGGVVLDILDACNGMHALLILLSAILAFPSSWSRRLLGIVAGTIAIFGFNLLRLVNLILVARFAPARLELFHLYVWQTLIVAIAFVLFITWGTYVADLGPKRLAGKPS